MQQTSLYDCDGLMSEGKVPGTNFVGVVHKSDGHAEENGIRPGSRVAGLMPSGANARYISVPSHVLHTIPKHLDSADVCAILSTFLPAFSALHHGCCRPHRYSRSFLKGRKVLIVGCESQEAHAAVRLAQIAGATNIYVTAPKTHSKVLEKYGASVLGEDPKEWLPHVKRQCDVVLDYQFPNNFHEVRAALARKGR